MLKEIHSAETSYTASDYTESGIYHNTFGNSVVFVNKSIPLVSYIGTKETVEEILFNNTKASEQKQSGISEEYSLKLVQTIIKELK